MKICNWAVVIALSALVAACGGGGGNSAAVIPPATTAGETPSIIEILNTSGSSLLSAGAEATVTAYIKNSANVGLAKQKVVFAASSGALEVKSSETSETGIVTAKLIAGSDKSTREITVTVSSGSASASLVIPVTGTTLTVAGDGSLQAGAASARYSVRAVDSSGSPIAKARITVKSTLGNSLSASTLETDVTGVASVLYTANIAGTDSLVVTGLGTSASTTVSVSAVDFNSVSPASNTVISVASLQPIRFRYRVSGVGVEGKVVSFSTTRGVLSAANAVTDANGEAAVSISSTTAGPSVVVAQIAGAGQVNLPLNFVATIPSSIIVQANPGAILPNSTGSANQSTIEATVRDASGNVVAGRQVNFTALADLSNGTLSPGIATTDSNGKAQVQFIAGANSTQSNGVSIQAQVANTSVAGVARLTVNGKALFITIGFGNTIGNLDETTYSKDFSVYVNDANGVAVGNQSVSLSVIPTRYFKGTLSFASEVWGYTGGAVAATCINEDANQDGIMDFGEDSNGNSQLTPGNVAVPSPGILTTDTGGRANFKLNFGEQYAPWVEVAIVARASVAGTESVQRLVFGLSGLASDFTKKDVPPAGIVSPFGVAGVCSDPK